MTRRRVAVVLLALSIFAVAAVKALTWPIRMGDEAWFLQVLDRVASGEVLYRDVFFGATPLSVYLVAPLTTLLGVELLVVRAAALLCFLLIVAVCDATCRLLGSGDRSRILLAMALLAFALPVPLYGSLAILFLVACLGATLLLSGVSSAAREEGSARRALVAALAGALAGLSFSAKQNVGMYALAALLLALLRLEWGLGRGTRRLVTAALIGFASVVAIVIAPVWLNGAAPEFLDYAFWNKTTYLRLARVSYWDGLIWLLRSSGQGTGALAFLLLPIAFAALWVAWHQGRPEERRETEVVVLFSVAALASVFPRADAQHVAPVVPVFSVALVHSWRRIARGTRRLSTTPLAVMVGVLLACLVGVGLVAPVGAALRGSLHVSNQPHFRGVLLTPGDYQPVQAATFRLPVMARGERVFILSAHAGFLYLVTGTSNPTPFDYPLATAFGSRGEEQVISALSTGRIRFVCVDPRHGRWGILQPERLTRYVQEAMEPAADAGPCTLYRRREPRGPSASGGETALRPSGS